MANLTRQERLVLIFIGSALLLGMGLNFYQKKNSVLDLENVINERKSYRQLNLNNASLKDLAKNPEIGPFLAAAIVDFRNAYGPFQSLEELKLIKGISLSKLNQIRIFLTVD